MKKFLLILILTLSFQSWAISDDLKNFQIEGFAIGQSLLDHFTKKKIEEEINGEYAIMYNDQFIQVGVGESDDFPLVKQIINYDEITLVLKANDSNYRIYSVGGKIFCISFEKCIKKKGEITADLKIFFGDKVTLDSYKKAHGDDKTGESFTHDSDFIFKNSNHRLAVSYYQWSKKKDLKDNIKVLIHDEIFDEFLRNYY